PAASSPASRAGSITSARRCGPAENECCKTRRRRPSLIATTRRASGRDSVRCRSMIARRSSSGTSEASLMIVQWPHSVIACSSATLPNTTPLNSREPSGCFVRMKSMNKTFTPELSPEVLERLRIYAAPFQAELRHEAQRSWSGVYLRGLLQDGERKNIEAMVGRVPLPAELRDLKEPDQALQQFVNQSPWDDQKILKCYRTVMAQSFASPQGIFVIDDTGFPKQGKHSVGVQRQYCGPLGKKANCQVAVTVHSVSPKGHFPTALRLFLPDSWTHSPERLKKAGVPEEYRQGQTKGEIALALLDQVRSEKLLPGNLVITDA